MNLATVTFILGGILILVGILGGGFELREMKVPKVNWITRLVAATTGMVFILGAIGLDQNESRPADPDTGPELENLVPQPQLQTRVNFFVKDELGDGQVLESTRVFINGSDIGELALSSESPRASLAGWASNSGSYKYRLQSSLVVDAGASQQTRLDCHGDGIVHLLEGARYEVRMLGVQDGDCLEELVAVE